MPYAVIAEWAGGGRDTRNYDEVTRRMDVEDDPPAGPHRPLGRGHPDGDFRISDVWETREAYEAFRIGAADARGRGGPRPRCRRSGRPRRARRVTTGYELHHLVVPAPAALGR